LVFTESFVLIRGEPSVLGENHPSCRTVLGRGVTVLFTGREGTLVLAARLFLKI